jgi:hypothetical protein
MSVAGGGGGDIHHRQGFPFTLGQQFSFLSLRGLNVVIYQFLLYFPWPFSRNADQLCMWGPICT